MPGTHTEAFAPTGPAHQEAGKKPQDARMTATAILLRVAPDRSPNASPRGKSAGVAEAGFLIDGGVSTPLLESRTRPNR